MMINRQLKPKMSFKKQKNNIKAIQIVYIYFFKYQFVII